ncbi:MAG: rhomboid family intramembrane serine protease [Candidatus Aenigmarchaeota archaeon]|nr:rhomboid family intramembrane serine protease [Candidatus Aenigmarchaeota archaeon]
MRITTVLLLLNIAVFLWLGALDGATQHRVLDAFAFSSNGFFGDRPWTVVTSLFLHGSVAHLALNMLALSFFGGALETEIRKRDYLFVYVMGGIAGNLLSATVFASDQLSIGASGAIFALMGAAMLIKPFDFVAYPWIVPVPLLFVGVAMIVTNVLLFIAPPPDSNISFAAHIGGFALGLVYGLHKRGFVRGAVLLAAGLLAFFYFSQALAQLSHFDYTAALQTLIK